MNTKINQGKYKFFPYNNIEPQGWLKKQLEIQANGLSGNLHKFWPDIKDSAWIGGNAEGWERVPYWLDGIIPLAWLINDDELKATAKKYIDGILERQHEDGWIAPDKMTSTSMDNRSTYDIWAIFLVLKVLTEWYKATDDERVEKAVYSALKSIDKHIDTSLLFGWGQMRWFECLIPIIWLYERKNEIWILELALKIKCQGFNWESFFSDNLWSNKLPTLHGRWNFMSHVVNNAMAIKEGVLWHRVSGNKADIDSSYNILKKLQDAHGMVTGVFTGDECLAGTSPVQGTELCAVAEMMYSLEHMIAVTGDPKLSSLLEKITYNALPATFSPDMWSHQYDQQVNQVMCVMDDNPIYNTNSKYANLFGLEPNYGCCTANLSQAWPKFAGNTFMKADNGIAITAYAPCSATFMHDDIKVTVDMKTQYPFDDKIDITISCNKPIDMDLYLRVPEWTTDYSINTTKEIECNDGIVKLSGKWSDSDKIELIFPMEFKLIERPNNLFALQRGPLIYSVKIDEEWKGIVGSTKGYTHEYDNYEIYPKSPYNYALAIDKDTPSKSLIITQNPVSDMPFSPNNSPITVTAKAKRIKWDIERSCLVPAPDIDSISNEYETVTLIPYGATNLRLTEFPLTD